YARPRPPSPGAHARSRRGRYGAGAWPVPQPSRRPVPHGAAWPRRPRRGLGAIRDRTSAPPVVVGGAGARPPPVSPGRLPPCVEDGPSGRLVRPEPGLVFELLDQQFSDLARPALLDPETDRGRVQVDHPGEPGLAEVGAPAMVRLGLKQWCGIADDRGRERVPVLGERIVRRNDEDQMIVIPAMGHDPYVVAARELMVRCGQSPGILPPPPHRVMLRILHDGPIC